MDSYWKVLKLLIFIKLLTEDTVTSHCDYQPCNGTQHSMCKYPELLDRSAPDCNSRNSRAGLTNEHRKQILHAHNVLRQRVAQGKEPGQPEAANMMKLVWNPELETIAQRFANECNRGGLYDRCRNLLDGTEVGQNSIQYNFNLKNRTNNFYEILFTNVVQQWYGEVRRMNDTTSIDSYDFDPATGHYTQVAWADTDRLGCGFVDQDTGKDYIQPISMKCNYAVAGNRNGEKMYIRGKACSKCPHGSTCSQKYPGLCSAQNDDFDGIPEVKKNTSVQANLNNCLIISAVLVVFYIVFE